MWQEDDPWAGRNFAAAVFARDYGCLSFTWDWAAQFLALEPPTMSDDYFGNEHSEHPAASAPNSQGDSEGIPKPRAPLAGAVHSVLDEFTERRRRPPTQRSSSETVSIPTSPPTQPSVSHTRSGHRGGDTSKKS